MKPAATQLFTSVYLPGTAAPVYGSGNVVDLVGYTPDPLVVVVPSQVTHSVTVAVEVQDPFMLL